jgi:CPA2 family monovalent cation:H+ antiporter-2
MAGSYPALPSELAQQRTIWTRIVDGSARSDMHDYPLISTIAMAFTAAWLLGLLTQRLGLSPIVGYLVAGAIIGPYTPGYVGDVNIAHQLAEIGVFLLMFGVGLHFHLKDLLAVKSVAIPGAIGQSLVATLLGLVVCVAFGFSYTTGAVVGMAMAVASTVVLMRVLMDADMLNSPQGHVSVGWLLVEDIFTVVVLVLIPVLGNGDAAPAGQSAGPNLLVAVGWAFAKLGVLVAIVMVVGSRVIPWALVQVARLRSRELFTLTVLVFSIAIAAASYALFGASMALGAFLAGMMVGQSPVSHQAAADALPMRDAFAVLFFVSVGMLFDPGFVLQEPLMILAALAIILIAKPLSALVIVVLLGHSARIALTVALALAQIGEFSFILSDVARAHHIMPDSGHNMLVAAAIITITLNPLIFRTLLPLEAWLRRRPRLWSLLNGRAEKRALEVNQHTEHQLAAAPQQAQRLAIVVGYGPVGRSVRRLLSEAGLTVVVIDLNMDTVSELTAQGDLAVFGDASNESILEQAGMRRASHLVLTLPQSSARVAVVTAARNLNSDARILVRAHYLREREDLEKVGATAAVFEEAEVAVALARLVLADTGTHRHAMESKIRDLRLQLIRENMTNIQSRRVRGIMVPWTRVHKLPTSASQQEVLREIAEQRFSRWPVTDGASGRVVGYLLAKDLIADASANGDWTRLVRPLRSARPDDDIESTLLQMQSQGATVCIVEDAGAPIGMLTLEDILEQVVGRIEDVRAGGVVLKLRGTTREEIIAELAAVIPASRLPLGARVAELALAREQELSTDLGVGVAIPHARCPNLAEPLVVLGRSAEGIEFSSQSQKPVRLVLLLVTPLEHPDVQLTLLAQLARLAADESARRGIAAAASAEEIIDIIAEDRQPIASSEIGAETNAE